MKQERCRGGKGGASMSRIPVLFVRRIRATLEAMNARLWSILLLGTALPLCADRKPSLLDSDPEVVYLAAHVDDAVELKVVKEAPIYGDKEGRRPLGTVVTGQTVELQAMTARAYRVSARTTGNKVVGWVAPWAFSAEDPDFVANLKQFYERQIEVAKLIESGTAAVGMTLDEVGQALGEPTRRKVRRTGDGEGGRWEFIAYEEVSHYRLVRDPVNGRLFRQLSHVTKEERGKTVVEFENDVVTAIEESESDEGTGRVKIVIPPVVWGW